MPRACVIVLDGVGAGALPDAAEFGDEGSDTLGNVARAVGGLDLPARLNMVLAGALLVWQLASVSQFWTFFVISVLYGIIYAPTLALTNSLSFHHLPDRDRDFGKVRLWGTVGWIAAGIAVGRSYIAHMSGDGESSMALAAQALAALDDGDWMLAGLARFLEEGFRAEPQTMTWRGVPIYQYLAMLSE